MEESEVLRMQINARRRALVAELRSGRRAQAHGRLAKVDGTFCCLGVACEVAMGHGLPLEKKVELFTDGGVRDFYWYSGGASGSSTSLPLVVAQWFDFGSDTAVQLHIPEVLAAQMGDTILDGLRPLRDVWSADRWFTAITLNDDLKFTFVQIADCFEYTFLPQDWEARRGEEVTSG